MKRSYVQIEGQLYEKGTEPRSDAPMVMPDIHEYTSMIDGTRIRSRSQHREHLRMHGCVEIGNEIPRNHQYTGIPDAAPQQRKELIRAQFDALTHRQFKDAIRKDVERIKWNSRKD